MEKIAQFTVVRGPTETLITKVNELIAQSWQPWGGFQHAGHEGDAFTFYGQQAMVKYGDAPPTVVAVEAEAGAQAAQVPAADTDVMEQLRVA